MAFTAHPAELDWEAVAATGYTSLVYGLPVLLAPPVAALWNRRGRGHLPWWQLTLGSYLTAGAGLLGYVLAHRRSWPS